MSYICSTLRLSGRKFCDDLQTKLKLPLGEIQQTGSPEKAAKSVTPCFLLAVIDYKRLDASLYFNFTYFHTELGLRQIGKKRSAMIWIP